MNVTDSLSTIATETPDAPAVLTPEASLSYGELDRAVSWTAGSFRNAGLAQRDIAAIDLSNQIQHLISSLALARLGVGQVAFDFVDPPQRRRHVEETLRIVGTITEKTASSHVQTALIEPPSDDLRELKGLKPVAFETANDGTLPFLILRTSGTESGVPKFGLLPHSIAHQRIRAKGFELPEGPGSRYLSLGSLSFNSVKIRAFHCVLSGGCLALDGGIREPQSLVDFITAHGVNYVSCSPVQASTLIDIAKETEILLPGVRAFRVGSTFIPQPLREKILKRLTPHLYIAYGITEIGTVSIALPTLVSHAPGVVGKLVPGIQADVVDEYDAPLPLGMAGRLRLKSPGMITSYVDAPAETARVFRDGWFYSGDRVEFTHNRELIHHGRIDDMIIFDGININPAEIENALLRHPAVSEAAAFSIEDDVHGDVPFAAVVIKFPVPEDELLSHCRSWLGPHAPKGLYIVSGLPRNAAGKMLKNELQKMCGKEFRRDRQSEIL